MDTELPRHLFDETLDVIGLCDGVFDLMHWGHIRHLRACKMFCDILIVAVADDNYAKTKGSDRPFVRQQERVYSLSSLSCVDVVVLCDGSTNIINQIKPDIYFKTDGYIRDVRLDEDIFVQRMPMYVEVSTTILADKIRNRL